MADSMVSTQQAPTKKVCPVMIVGGNLRERHDSLSPSNRALWDTAVMELVEVVLANSPVAEATTP